jgi:hypothetical protein
VEVNGNPQESGYLSVFELICLTRHKIAGITNSGKLENKFIAGWVGCGTIYRWLRQAPVSTDETAPRLIGS